MIQKCTSLHNNTFDSHENSMSISRNVYKFSCIIDITHHSRNFVKTILRFYSFPSFDFSLALSERMFLSISQLCN